jgi:hypothetical protein
MEIDSSKLAISCALHHELSGALPDNSHAENIDSSTTCVKAVKASNFHPKPGVVCRRSGALKMNFSNAQHEKLLRTRADFRIDL